MYLYNSILFLFFFFFFNDTATTEIYTLSLHDALPISARRGRSSPTGWPSIRGCSTGRSEEHTSELQSQSNLVCRLLLEKKKKKIKDLKKTTYIKSSSQPDFVSMCIRSTTSETHRGPTV